MQQECAIAGAVLSEAKAMTEPIAGEYEAEIREAGDGLNGDELVREVPAMAESVHRTEHGQEIMAGWSHPAERDREMVWFNVQE